MRKLLFFYLALVLCGCANQNPNSTAVTLEFDVENYKVIDLNKCHSVCLDNEIAIGMVKSIQIVDSNLFVHSSAGLHLFNLNTGELKISYSRKGRGEDEYISLWSYSITDTIVQLYDMNRKRILEYSIAGKFIQAIDIPSTYSDNPFQAFIPIGDKYLGKRVYGGASDIPELSLYDSNFRYLGDILPELKLRSGLMLHNPFALNSEGQVLYCRYFDNTIYEITKNTARPTYFIDFNRNSFNKDDEFKDEYDIIDYINTSRTNYAVNFSNIQEDECFLSFSYLYDSSKRIALYDKKDDMTYSVVPISEAEIIDQIYRIGKLIYLLTQSNEGSTKLYKYKFSK